MPGRAEAPAVIHDLGYRGYQGTRLGEAAIARALWLTGVRHCFGLGRSGRSKVLPMALLALMLMPAVILVGVLVKGRQVLHLDDQIVAYSTYPVTTQVLISVFVAAQAATLITRDLRFGTISLYLARPVSGATYVLVRLASLAAATALLVAAPLLLLYAGGLLADLPPGRETGRILVALAGAVLLAACVAAPAAVVASLTTRRGLAVAAVIVILLLSYTGVSVVQGIAVQTHHELVGQVAGMFSPYTLLNGVQVALFHAPAATPTPPHGAGMATAYLAVIALTVLGSIAAMLLRYRDVSP